TGCGKTMLIDGGGFPDNNVFDVGRYIVAPCLRANKIGAIDTVVLSHPDSDHLNGLFYVLENFRVGRVIKGPSGCGAQSWQSFLNLIENSEIRNSDFENTARSLKVNGAEIHLLHPQARQDGSPKCSGANNNSIVLRVEYGGRSVLFPGDIEKCAESEIVSRAGKLAESDVLIAPHHGSKTSSGQRFLKTVDPESVIVSARKRGYGPPSEKILKRYKKKGCRVLRTDKKGAAHIRLSPEGEISIEPEISGKMG
ncbi:MAG: ComEC/Rec2 family competence protein, partial [Desulfosalsimonas sp.]